MAETAKPFIATPHSKVSRADSKNYESLFRHDPPNIIAVKTLESEFTHPDEIERFYNEYEVSQITSHPGIRKALCKAKIRNKHTLLMEWIDGQTIREYGKRSVREFLHLARQIVEALAELHRHCIVHNNVNLDNIMVNPDTRQVKIIGLGQCSMVDGEKINHSVDANRSYTKSVYYRLDLYCLGHVFYFMLVGNIPFETDDRNQLMDMNEACHPPSMSEVDPTIPTPLSNLVQNLMQENPVDGYQSAKGLLYDLEIMHSQFESHGAIASDFTLAQKGCLGQFRVCRKFYGRTRQIATLLSAFNRVRRGESEAVMVAGFSGTGKSSLVRELQTPVMNHNGYFISGKFDHLQKFEPYSAILQAFNNLCDLLLTESKEKYHNFRMLIQEAVGTEGRILTDVIPKLQFIIGDQPDVPEVGCVETKNRFNHVFCRFVKAICTVHHPMLLFLDDLQWSDPASLDLVSVLMSDKQIKYLLFVGSYRDNEVCDSHQCSITLDKMKENNVNIRRIKVGNLGRESMNELISDSLHSTQEEMYTLTDLVQEKTYGNVYFAIEFLKSLLNENLLHFSHDEFKWKWDISGIEKKDVTENVVGLIVLKIRTLPEKTQNVLKMASCLGNQFHLSTLQIITEEKKEEYVKEALRFALNEDVIINPSRDKKYRFAHDKIQQAVYSMIPESDRNLFHLKIGRRLKRDVSSMTDCFPNEETQQELPLMKESRRKNKRKLDENLFVVVNQFNSGLDLITRKHERIDVSRLNLRAGKKARLSSAFQAASGCLARGIELLGFNHWKEDYELSLELYVAAVEMDYCNGDFEHMNEMLDQVFTNATSILDKIECYSIQMKYFRSQKKMQESLETGLRVLEQLGETFPAQPTRFLILLELIQTKWVLWNNSNDVIASMSTMVDRNAIAALRIMVEIILSIAMTQSKLMPFLYCRIIQITMKFGISKWSMVGFMGYGLINCAHLGNKKEGYRFRQLSLELLDRFPEKELRCYVYLLGHACINRFNESIHLSLKPLQHVIQIGKEVGEIEYSFMAAWRYCCHLFLGGYQLSKVKEEMKTAFQQMKAYKQEHALNLLAPYWQAVLNFQGCGSEDPTTLTGKVFDENVIQTCTLGENGFARIAVYLNSMVLAYFFNDYERAGEKAEESRNMIEKKPRYKGPIYWFYYGLISLALAREIKNDVKWIKTALECIAKIKDLVQNAPDNFLNKAHLLEAELAIWKGYTPQAMMHFDKAIELAESQKFLHEEALACERAGVFCIETGRVDLATEYLSRAYQVYQQWGAEAKVRHLEKLFGSQINFSK